MAGHTRISYRELRNHVSDCLQRVAGGETFEITANDRSVALLLPTPDRPRTVSTRQLLATVRQADPGLRDVLAAELTQTTDDL